MGWWNVGSKILFLKQENLHCFFFLVNFILLMLSPIGIILLIQVYCRSIIGPRGYHYCYYYYYFIFFFFIKPSILVDFIGICCSTKNSIVSLPCFYFLFFANNTWTKNKKQKKNEKKSKRLGNVFSIGIFFSCKALLLLLGKYSKQ